MPESPETEPGAAPSELPRHDLLPVYDIEEDPNQPRKTFADDSLDELAREIEGTADGSESPWIHGLLHPVVVYPNPAFQEGGETPPYRLLTGARRLRAYRRRGWPAIPAQVRESPSSTARTIMTQIVENDAREGVGLYEKALAVRRAFEAWRAEHPRGKAREFAAAFGRSAAWVSQHLGVARAKGLAKQALEEDRIRHGEAFRLFTQLTVEEQQSLLAQVRRSRSNVTARMVKALLAARSPAPAGGGKPGGAPARAAGKGVEAGTAAPAGKEGQTGPPPESEPAGEGPILLRLDPGQVRRLLEALAAPVPEEDKALAPALLEALVPKPPPPARPKAPAKARR